MTPPIVVRGSRRLATQRDGAPGSAPRVEVELEVGVGRRPEREDPRLRRSHPDRIPVPFAWPDPALRIGPGVRRDQSGEFTTTSGTTDGRTTAVESPGGQPVTDTISEAARWIRRTSTSTAMRRLPWSRAEKQLESTTRPRRDPFPSTVRPDGRPHVAGIGAVWFDGNFYFRERRGDAKRAGTSAENAACAIAVKLPDIDLVVEGYATKVTDGPTLERLAERYNAEGWPATVERRRVHGAL